MSYRAEAPSANSEAIRVTSSGSRVDRLTISKAVFARPA